MTTKLPPIPKPPAELSPEVRRYLEALAEAVEVRLGRRGDPKDRAVTLRELIASGLAIDLKANQYDPNNITNSNIGFTPNNSSNRDLTIPPSVLEFTAASLFTEVLLSWTNPIYAAHAQTLVFISVDNDFENAVLDGQTTGSKYLHKVGTAATTNYYWVRHISKDGILGPLNGPLEGTTASDVDFLLDTLSESITSSELAAALSAPIGNLPNDTAALITNLDGQYTVKIDNNGSIAGFGFAATTSDSGNVTSDFIVAADKFALMPSTNTAIEDWENATAYVVGDQVKSDDDYYICIQDHTATAALEPHDAAGAAYWSQTNKAPFVVTTSPQTAIVDEVEVTIADPGVYIDAAFIKNASITSAQIGSVNADTIDAGTISAEMISGGTLSTSLLNIDGSTITTNATTGALEVGTITIDSADITDGSITDAKIGGAIQSSDYSVEDASADPPTVAAGWKIDKAGAAEFTNATFRGSLEAPTGTIGSVTLATDGNIKSGQTAYNTGTGFFLGNDNGTAKFSIGSGNSSLTWDGSSLVLKNTKQNFTKGNNPLVVSTKEAGWYNTNGFIIIKSITVSFSGTVKVKASGTKNIAGAVYMGVGQYLIGGNPSHGNVNLPYNNNSQVIDVEMTVSAGDTVHLYGKAGGNNFGSVGFNTSFGLYVAEQPPVPAVITLEP